MNSEQANLRLETVNSKQRSLFTAYCLLIALLLLAFTLMLGSALRISPTVDEQSHLFRGAAYLKANATHFLLGHPIGNSTLAALPLLTEPDLQLPTEIPAWEIGNWSVAGDHFLWRSRNNPQRTIFLGRLPMIFCTLILGCFIFRWGRQLGNVATGLVAATLILFDPNILAHGRLVSSDVTLTLFWAVAIYGYWRWSQHGKPSAVVLAGFGLGMASLMKFNAAFLLPTLAILAGLEWWRRRRTREPIIALVGTFVVGGVVIWVVNRFSFTPLPGGAFWDDLFWQMEYFGRNTGGYLLGNYDSDGSLLYFPLAFLIKTPLSTLVIVLLGFFFSIKNKLSVHRSLFTVYLVIPTIIFCLTAFTAGFNIGIRHLLPLYPYLYLFVACGLSRAAPLRMTFGLLAISVIVAIWTFPNYLAYFNQLVGGSENGWHYLADSNVDWGQALPALADWQAEHDDQPLYLSYFGTAHAAAYGIDFEPIPAPIITPDQPPAERQAHDPRQPRPGYYAISVNNLIGFPMPNGQQDVYAAFRTMEPIERIGDAIFVYEVAPTGKRVDVALAETRPELLPDDIYQAWGTNDIHVRWFDAPTTRLILPNGQHAHIVTNELPATELLSRINSDLISADMPPYMYTVANRVKEESRQFYSDELDFLGYWMIDNSAENPTFITAWQTKQLIETPLQIFAHATDSTGAIISQSDMSALDPFSTWYRGDIYLQRHQLNGLGSRSYDVTVGFYSAETINRLAEPISLFNIRK